MKKFRFLIVTHEAFDSYLEANKNFACWHSVKSDSTKYEEYFSNMLNNNLPDYNFIQDTDFDLYEFETLNRDNALREGYAAAFCNDWTHDETVSFVWEDQAVLRQKKQRVKMRYEVEDIVTKYRRLDLTDDMILEVLKSVANLVELEALCD